MSTVEARGRLKDARRNLYRAAVLDAAEATFANAGYEAAKVADIARDAGVSLATFYSVFGKKWDVYREVHARRLSELMGQAQSQRLNKASLLQTLVDGVDNYLRFHMLYPNYLRMHLREGVAWTTTEGLRSREQSDAWQAGLGMMMSTLKVGIEQGLFVDEDPELMARTLIGMHQVRLAVWIERGQTEAPDELIRGAVRQLIRAFCPAERVEELMSAARVGDERVSK